SHAYHHTPLWQKNEQQFRNEITATNKLIEDFTGKKVKGFRAPYASLNNSTAWVLPILEEEGFIYDSSIFPMKTPLYGVSNAPLDIYRIDKKNILKHHPNAALIEIPFTIFKYGFVEIPCTGGIYGRYLPLPLLKFLLNQISVKRSLNFYFHPWETDKDIPKIDAPLYNKMVAYYRTGTYLERIEAIISSFQFTSFEKFLEGYKI